MKKEIVASKAHPAVGPYSQAIKAGDLVFCSGSIGIGPKSDGALANGIKAQTKAVLNNLRQVLIAAGGNLDDVVKTTVYLENMDDYAEMNKVYESFFHKPYPARATVSVVKLPRSALVEIECIAVIK